MAVLYQVPNQAHREEDMQINGLQVDVFALIGMIFKHTAGGEDFAHKVGVLNKSGKNWNRE